MRHDNHCCIWVVSEIEPSLAHWIVRTGERIFGDYEYAFEAAGVGQYVLQIHGIDGTFYGMDGPRKYNYAKTVLSGEIVHCEKKKPQPMEPAIRVADAMGVLQDAFRAMNDKGQLPTLLRVGNLGARLLAREFVGGNLPEKIALPCGSLRVEVRESWSDQWELIDERQEVDEYIEKSPVMREMNSKLERLNRENENLRRGSLLEAKEAEFKRRLEKANKAKAKYREHAENVLRESGQPSAVYLAKPYSHGPLISCQSQYDPDE